MTNQEIKTVGQTIAAETQIGGNTAERVGGVIEGIGDALDNKDAAVGYYLATMSGSTIYINASSYRLGTGGNLRAKMPAAATTACTLTVGNAQAVQLWYNGAAVSADNSWEAGEIVTIFYDGTRFMASNSQGGGGQFGSGEKIKDILLSQVLGAGTDAITSQKCVSDAIFNEIDISSIDTLKTLNDALAPSSSLKPTYYTVTATLSSVKLKVGSMAVISDNMRHVVTEIMATHYILDDAGNLTNEHSDAEIFFIYRSVKLSGGTLPDPAGTWTKWRYVNSSVWSTVAEKIKYDNSQSGLKSTNVQKGLDEIGNEIFSLGNPSTIPAGTSTRQYYTYQNGSIVIGSNKNFRCWAPIDISEYYALRINFYLPVNTNPAAAKTFFTDENDVMVGDFLYNTSGDYKEYIVPEGAKKLYWSTNYNIQSSVGLRGIIRTNKIDEKVDKQNFLLSLDAVENYARKEYHNGAFSSVSNATCRKYDVAEFENIYVTTRWKSATAGYYKVVFVDEENTTISQLFVNTEDVDVTLTRKKVAVPSNAKYVYVNNRYGVGMPIVEIEGSGVAIEKKINENSIKKEISILFIGNSLTQDAVTYVPLLLKELAPDLKFKIYIWYNGGYTLSQQLADFNNNVACDIFSVCEDGTSWANFNNSVTMASVLSTYKFDIVSIQEYFNYQETVNVSVFNSVVEYIENHYAYPFKVVTLFHQPKRDTPAVIFERTKVGNATLLKETVAEDMIPSGIAIYRALSTTLDSLGDRGHLSPDGTHAQEGLPCMMQAYVTAMWILKQIGIPMSVNNASSIVDDSNYNSINVPGPNLGTGVVIGTTEQVRLSQLVAVKALKEGEYIRNKELTEYTT